MTLNEVMKDTADAIREKTGKSEKIAPVNFAEEIKGITAGGGESGGSNVEYLALDDNWFLADVLGPGIVEAKIFVENAPFPIEGIICSGLYFGVLAAQLREMGATLHFVAASFNRDAVVSKKQSGVVTTQTAYEQLVSQGDDYIEAYNNLARLTKEQFYSLE